MDCQHIYQDESRSAEERARSLVSHMTLEECASQVQFESAAIPRLGIKSYNWWNEALHGVARAGMATVFPQAIGLAATFSPELIEEMALAIADEARAKWNEFQAYEDHGIYKGLTFWSPNVNIFRDPRWGRGQETYGEDPYLTATLGAAFVRGLQGDGKVMKAAACAKHFAVHSGPEKTRHEFDSIATKQDMAETYLPAFKALCDAGVEGFMGAYNRLNGEPCCASPVLMDILRNDWGFQGYFTSDCGAIVDFHLHHRVTSNILESAALAMNTGCDLNCGSSYVKLQAAIEAGLTTEEKLRESAVRVLTTRIKLGMLDASTPYDKISYEVVDCDAHRELNYKVACRSLVLLQNDGTLPLNKAKLRNVAVIGPNAGVISPLLGNYHGTGNEYHTILDAIREALPEARVNYAKGSHLTEHKLEDPGYAGDGLAEVKTQCRLADAVILVTGLDETVEGEEWAEKGFFGDRESLYLPEAQRELIKTVCASGKPVVLVNLSGSATDFAEGMHANAIIQGWYPGAMGGKAVADLIFGAFSPSGKLPVTFYKQENTLPDLEDYSMNGRTYKFFTEEPLFPFGFGLSYSRFAFCELKAAKEKLQSGEPLACSVTVTNTGSIEAEEVVELYLRDEEASVRIPRHKLCGMKRVRLQGGESAEVRFTVNAEAFCVVDEDGGFRYEAGTFTLFAGGCQPDEQSERLYGARCAAISIQLGTR